MKKAILACFAVLISTSLAFSAPNNGAASSAGTSAQAVDQQHAVCVDIAQELANGKSEEEILDGLIDPACGMSLQEAVDAITGAGGDLVSTLAGALVINSEFTYIPATDPTAGLSATSAGSRKTGNASVAPSAPLTGFSGGGSSALDD